jgi:O-succinylbenzoic acid--CoA ligase
VTVDEFIAQWHDSNDFVVAHTSGSTGAPKEIRLKKEAMRQSATATNAFFRLTERSHYVCPLSPDYIAGKMMVVRSLMSGGSLEMLVPSNSVRLTRRADLLAIVPSQVESILSQAEMCGAVIVGGAALSAQSRQRLIDAGINAWESYGMTETCSHVALRRVGTDIFCSLPGIRFSADSRGCLIVDAPKLVSSPLVTNDVVELISDSQFRWLGRADHVINSGGIKIHPEQLEAEIAKAIPEMPEFYIVGAPDDKWGNVPVLVHEGSAPLDLATRLADSLDHRQLPRKVVAVKSLPRTSNGKILRKRIE